MHYARDLWETLFIQMIMADDRAIRATYVNGRKLYERDRS
jgi:guanine deaminase